MRARLLPALLVLIALPGCAKLTLAWTDMDPNGPVAAPAISTPNADEWARTQKPALQERLQSSVYGFFPDASDLRVLSHNILNPDAFGGKGRIEEYALSAKVEFDGVGVETRDAVNGGFVMDVVLPVDADGPVPVILLETFCPRWITVREGSLAGAPAEVEKPGLLDGVGTYVFGRYICTPPIEMILDAGYAIATIFPSEIVPDREEDGLAELRRLSAGHQDDETRWGAIAAWGWAYSRMIDVLEADPRFDKNAMIAWGHSRYGKAALIAAAFDDRIDGVIAHQSGTGGASLNAQKKGEGVKEITNSYPHWFARAYREENLGGYDQHMLLALAAPRPVLLGNARRDVWSDPNGAFRAAIGADPVYEMLGSRGLEQDDLRIFNPGADISFWIRPGTHGVVEEDWPAFLLFLDAHFKANENG